jgi:hypothetical protein
MASISAHTWAPTICGGQSIGQHYLKASWIDRLAKNDAKDANRLGQSATLSLLARISSCEAKSSRTISHLAVSSASSS